MSYDLHAFGLSPGSDPEHALEALEEAVFRAPSEQEREGMRHLAAALRAAVPALEPVELDDAIELSEEGFQVTVDATGGAISIPYWFDGDEARAVLDRALECARVLRHAGELAVWDPQLDALVEDHTPVEDLADAYAEGRRYAGRLDE